jgi:uncharacterized Zn finger protein
MSRRYRDTWYYPPSKPKEVKGGIKAQSKRGAFANQWWGKRWIETIESFRIGARLSRGRSYARKGQVASLNIDSGLVTANVQGSRSGQYRVRIAFKVLTDKQWQKMLGQLIEEPIFAARLLSNEMPEEIEGVFEKAGLHLFPQRKGDLKTECSCPDWSNPCKHIAAVFYLMAEAFDNDPFLLFKLRGMGREAFLEKLRGTGATEEATGQVAGPQTEPVPLPTDMQDFWQVSPDSTNTVMPAAKVSLHAAIPKRWLFAVSNG